MSERINPFVLQAKDYKRDIDVLKHYIDQGATYLATMTDKPYEVCYNYIRDQVKPGGKFEFKDPSIQYLERDDNGDRSEKTGGLYWYLSTSIKETDIIAPTFTTYYHPKKKKSLYATYIGLGKKRRNIAKKEMYAAEMAEDWVKYAFKKGEQTNAKQKNNSLSGGHNSASTTLWNKTAHSTLTSTCRSTSGYGNANNEKFLAGNRHYWAPMIVTNNITSIIRHTNYPALEAVIAKYNMHCPTPQEMCDVIRYSTHHYWRNEPYFERLLEYASKLTPTQRAAFVYTGDMYHIRKYNDALMRKFLNQYSFRMDAIHPDPASVLATCFEDQRNLAMQICSHVSKGFSAAELLKGGKEDKGVWVPSPPNAAGIVASTIENIYNTTVEYADLIKMFFVSNNVPASMAYFPESIRHTALMSDTDSTIFTAQEWVEWMHGKIGFSDEENNLSSAMINLAAASITHVLAKMSANLGVDESMMFMIAMKNEFKFDVFVPTQEAKHYFAYISCSEGNVYKKMKEEIKGVHLKNSNVSKYIMKTAKSMMVDTMDRIMQGEMINLRGSLKEVADIERAIHSSVTGGSHDFFRFGRVNSLDSYKRKEDSDGVQEPELKFMGRTPYRFYTLWQDVFAPDYGDTPAPPYTCLKLSSELDSPTKTRVWIETMENKELANRLKLWMTKYDKKYLGMVLLPEQIIQSRGIPKELLQVVDVRNMVADSTAVFYKIMESFGIYMLDDKRTKLFMDYY